MTGVESLCETVIASDSQELVTSDISSDITPQNGIEDEKTNTTSDNNVNVSI